MTYYLPYKRNEIKDYTKKAGMPLIPFNRGNHKIN
jgi:hypothetical protein